MDRQLVTVNIRIRLCVLFLLIVRYSNAENSEVSVTLSTGRVAGLRLVSAVNRVYYSFQGIPYATPPIGYLRFKPPRPPQKWNGTLKAFQPSPACAQPRRRVQFPEKYSEDCLYINVFTPYLQPPEGTLLPVMVWIHGGKHYQGSGTKYKYGPDFLLTGDVVLVTFDYRLGVFGFLNLNTRSAQGNAGLKDMVAALRWVQKEIRHFGGDPDRVTIFGGSTGGQDVSCLYLSPLSQGLFHRAISQSAQFCGSVGNANTVASSRALTVLLGCSHWDPHDATTCLRDVSTEVLAERQMEVVPTEPGGIPNPFVPSVEVDGGEERALPQDPAELLHASRSSVPYLLGLNTGEGNMELQNPRESPDQFHDLERHFVEYLPYNVRQKASEKSIQYIVNVLKKFYFNNQSISMDTVEGFVKFMTDKRYTYDIVTHAMALSNHTNVYLYLFAFQGAFEDVFEATKGMNLTGVGHGRELGYLFFRNSVVEAHNHLSDFPDECEVVTKMVRLWTNFAKYGQPTPHKDDPILGTTWLPVNGTATRHLMIDRTLTMNTSSLYADRVALWDLVYRMAEQDMVEASWTVAMMIIAAVCALSLASLTFLLYDCCCRTRDQYTVLD